jgi:preflagellin peptidase FlaK
VAGSIDALRLLIGAGFLLYASVLDWRTRRVRNAVWIAVGALGLLLWPVEAFVTYNLQWLDVLVVAVVVAGAYVMWFVHVLAGGADAKAVMAVAVLVPTPIAWSFAGTPLPLWPSVLPAAVVVLANAVVAFAFVPFALAAYNLARADLHVPAMFLGYRMRIEEAARRFVWVVDTLDADGRLRRTVMPSRRSPEAHAQNLRSLRAAGHERVWVTPKIPFMIPLLGGFVAAFTLGDVIFRAVSAVLGP